MRRILLLSNTYEPLNFITERRVLSLVIRDVVDLVSFWDGDVLMHRSFKDGKPITMPATVRLNRWVSHRSRLPKFKRQVVFARDNYECQYCFKSLSTREATIDHVLPKSLGGATTWKNTVTACRACNRLKDDNTPEKAGMALWKKPAVPTLAHFWDTRITDDSWHPEWNQFIPR